MGKNMELNAATELRIAVIKLLNTVIEEITIDIGGRVNNKWFGKQIDTMVEHNLLTPNEVDTLFGWRQGIAEECQQIFHGNPLYSNRLERPAAEIRQRTMMLVGAIAAKYKLRVSLQISEPVVHVVTEVVQEKTEAKWHVPLDEFQWFRDLSVRARNGIINLNCSTLGDLVVLTPKELRIQNFGPKSKEEVEQALKFEGLWLGMLTRQEHTEYFEKYQEQES